MGKVIFWLVVVFVALFALRIYNVAKMRKARGKPKSARDTTPASMVRCVQCGVFLPKPEAVETTTGYRCQDPACAVRH